MNVVAARPGLRVVNTATREVWDAPEKGATRWRIVPTATGETAVAWFDGTWHRWMKFTGDGWVVEDKDGKILAEHKKTGGEDIHLHHTNLHNHLRNGEPLNCPVELGMAGVAAVNMANESWRSGRMIAWDKDKEKMVPADSIQLSHEPEETV